MADFIYIHDDLGLAWYFQEDKDGQGRIKCVLADLDEIVPAGENGYHCDSLEEGIKLLNEYGYITGYEYDEDNKSTELNYFTKTGE